MRESGSNLPDTKVRCMVMMIRPCKHRDEVGDFCERTNEINCSRDGKGRSICLCKL